MKKVFLLLAFFLTIFVSHNLKADEAIPYDPPKVELSGNACNPENSKISIRILDFVPYHASLWNYYTVSLNIPASYGQICSATVVYAGTDDVASAWAFDSYASLTQSNWQTFVADVSNISDFSVPVDLVFEILPTYDSSLSVEQYINCFPCEFYVNDLIDYIETATDFLEIGGMDEIDDIKQVIAAVPAADVCYRHPYCVTPCCTPITTSFTDTPNDHDCIGPEIEAQTIMVDLDEINAEEARFIFTADEHSIPFLNGNHYVIIVREEDRKIIAYQYTSSETATLVFEEHNLNESNCSYIAYGYITTGRLDPSVLRRYEDDPCLDIDTSLGLDFSLCAPLTTEQLTSDVVIDEDCNLIVTLCWKDIPCAEAYQLIGRKQGRTWKVFPQSNSNTTCRTFSKMS